MLRVDDFLVGMVWLVIGCVGCVGCVGCDIGTGGITVMDIVATLLSVMTIDYLEGETIVSRKASGRSISYIARVLVYLTERAMVWLGGVTISADRESPVSLSSAPRAMSTGLSASVVTC